MKFQLGTKITTHRTVFFYYTMNDFV